MEKRMRLDTSANIYPAIATKEYPQVYRLSVSLVTRVAPELLQRAVREVLPDYPIFQYGVRKGKRWCFLEKSDELPVVGECDSLIPQPFEDGKPCFRVNCRKNEICLEIFHALTDGNGCIRFLHAICYRYCELQYADCLPKISEEQPQCVKTQDMTDPYTQLAKQSGKGNYWHLLRQKRAFPLPKAKKSSGIVENTTFSVSLGELKKDAQKYHATVCEYLAATCLQVLWRRYRCIGTNEDRPLRIAVPVNLRPIFEMETERNFFLCIPIEADLRRNYTLESMVTAVQEQFARRCNREYLLERIGGLVKGQSNPIAGNAPLWLKNWFLRQVYQHNGYNTMILSNLGRLLPQKKYEPFIVGYRCFLPITQREPLKVALWSYGENLTVSVTYCQELGNSVQSVIRQLETQGMTVQEEYSEEYYQTVQDEQKERLLHETIFKGNGRYIYPWTDSIRNQNLSG